MIYLGDSWPDQYRGKVFMNNIHGQRLNMDILERKAPATSGVTALTSSNFNDTWSQVLNFLYDQNGSVYIIDWYDKNQCHHNDVNGHDRSNGRIFKLVYNDQKWTRSICRRRATRNWFSCSGTRMNGMSVTRGGSCRSVEKIRPSPPGWTSC